MRAVIIPRIFPLGVVTCLAVVVMVVACFGGSEPAPPAGTVAVGATPQPADIPVSTPTEILAPTTELTNGQADAGSTPGDLASVSAGFDHTCGVRTNGAVACWGNDHGGQASPPDGVFFAVSAGWAHSCGVKTDGSVACWGKNDFGQSKPPK